MKKILRYGMLFGGQRRALVLRWRNIHVLPSVFAWFSTDYWQQGEAKQVESMKRQVEHFKRKAYETGETHSRNAKGNR
jgi:predicted solute-binding protein